RRAGRGRLDGLDLLRAARPAELRVLEEAHALDHAADEGPALEQLVLGLVVVVAGGVHLGHFLEGQDAGRVALDQDLGGRLVDRTGEERAERGQGGHPEEHGEDEPPAPEDDVDVFPEMRFLGLAFVAGGRARAHGRRTSPSLAPTRSGRPRRRRAPGGRTQTIPKRVRQVKSATDGNSALERQNLLPAQPMLYWMGSKTR